jgi:hypothetical protein
MGPGGGERETAYQRPGSRNFRVLLGSVSPDPPCHELKPACRSPASPILFLAAESISLPGELAASSPTTAQKLR